MTDTNGILYVGIDLGTSRSAVSASNGQRHVVDSYVGWPVDMVARKILKRSVLVGREALENRSMLDLRRPLERGLLKEGSERDAEAVRQLLKHLLSLVGVEDEAKPSARVRAVVGVPAEALRVSKQQLRNVMKGLVDGLLIVSEPFSVAYAVDALLHALIIDIGAGTTDLCVMNGRYPTESDQRTLLNAGDWVDEQLFKLIQAHHPEANFSLFMVREWKEKAAFVGKAKAPVLVTAPIKGKPTQLDITEELRTACEGLVPPVAETMVDLIARVDPEYQEKVRGNVILAGGSSGIAGLDKALQEALKEIGGGRVQAVKDPIFAGCDGGLAIATDADESDWEKLSS
ncbi:MAG: rod shape-determining protein [Thermoanaerobaculaceae bacterium]|jgi:rod shape-determining protein MreB|nr:rod shape-determining protein [Thermoanaerobaculaceae bacterium]